MNYSYKVCLTLVLGLIVCACEEGSKLSEVQQLEGATGTSQDPNDAKGDESTQESFTYADIQAIWDQKCVSCHSSDVGYPAADLSLEAGDSLEALVNVYSLQAYDLPLIAPNDLDASYLWQKINNQQYDVDGEGDMMPPSYMPDEFQLTEQDFALIEAWIMQGAGESFTLTRAVVDEPTEPSDEPTEPSDEPTEPSDEPTEPSDEPTEPSVSYEEVQAIYNGSCTSCHGEPGIFGVSGNLSLAAAYSYDATVNVSSSQQRDGMYLIAPGAPEESYLWHKINNTHNQVGGSGRGMSPGFFGYNSLPQNELDLIETWILEGAQR